MPESVQPTVMDDPSSRGIARTYAGAFLAAAGDGAGELLDEFTSFQDDVLNSQPDFARLVTGSVLSQDEQLQLINRTVAKFASPLFTNFLRVLARHGRLYLLPSILLEAHLQYETAGGQQRVEVTSAVPLTEEQTQRIVERLKATLPFDPILIPKVDPRVLGGLTIQVGDTVYDTSVRSRLNQLRTRLRQRSSHEIQSGRDRFRH